MYLCLHEEACICAFFFLFFLRSSKRRTTKSCEGYVTEFACFIVLPCKAKDIRAVTINYILVTFMLFSKFFLTYFKDLEIF
jgi:hypothetical protein